MFKEYNPKINLSENEILWLITDLNNDDVYQDRTTGNYYIPLYTERSLPDHYKAYDIINILSCSNCGQTLLLAQSHVDTLFLNYYNKNKEKIFGVCFDCCKAYDITSLMNYLI